VRILKKKDELQNFDWETPVENYIRSTEASAWRIILMKILSTVWGSRLNCSRLGQVVT